MNKMHFFVRISVALLILSLVACESGPVDFQTPIPTPSEAASATNTSTSIPDDLATATASPVANFTPTVIPATTATTDVPTVAPTASPNPTDTAIPLPTPTQIATSVPVEIPYSYNALVDCNWLHLRRYADGIVLRSLPYQTLVRISEVRECDNRYVCRDDGWGVAYVEGSFGFASTGYVAIEYLTSPPIGGVGAAAVGVGDGPIPTYGEWTLKTEVGNIQPGQPVVVIGNMQVIDAALSALTVCNISQEGGPVELVSCAALDFRQ
jgi:hypothetical protein